MAVGLSRPDGKRWTMIGREDVVGGSIGAVVDVRTRDSVVERVIHGAWREDGAQGIKESTRLNQQEARVLQEFAEHPERFIRYNPDDDESSSIDHLDFETPVG